MNIRFLNSPTINPLTFCATQKTKRNLSPLTSDTVEFSYQNSIPLKRELNEIEKEFNEVLIKYNTASQNAKSQKELLKVYYSAQDKYDYQTLLKEKNKLKRQLKKIAKKANIDEITMEMNILEKQQYNRYTPKICRANSLSELTKLQKLIDESLIFFDIKTFLLKIITERKQYLKRF